MGRQRVNILHLKRMEEKMMREKHEKEMHMARERRKILDRERKIREEEERAQSKCIFLGYLIPPIAHLTLTSH